MKRLIAALVLPVFLVGCGTEATTANPSTPDDDFHGSEITLSDETENYMPKIRPDYAVEVETPGDNVQVFVVTIEGKKCWLTNYDGGIWCEDATTTTEAPDGFE